VIVTRQQISNRSRVDCNVESNKTGVHVAGGRLLYKKRSKTMAKEGDVMATPAGGLIKTRTNHLAPAPHQGQGAAKAGTSACKLISLQVCRNKVTPYVEPALCTNPYQPVFSTQYQSE
jgi:hypothetical protein